MSLPLLMMMGASGGVADVTWATWLEDSEANLSGGSQGADINICFMEDPDAGDDEVSQGGGLTGADLVFTQAGNLAGATGSPPTRVFNGTNNNLTVTTPFLDGLIANANKTWTIMAKLTDITLAADNFWYLADAAGNELIRLYLNGPGWEMAGAIEEDTVVEADITANGMSALTEYYVAMWADGTKVYHGFTTSGSGANGQPTVLSDFAAGDRHLYTSKTGDFAGETFDHATQRTFMSVDIGFMAADVSYIAVSKVCLIDNGA